MGVITGGQLREGITLTQKGVDSFRRVGHTVLQTHRLAMLVEMHMMAHQFAEAQIVLAEAFSISAEKGEHFWDVDLYRLQGDLLLAQDEPEIKLKMPIYAPSKLPNNKALNP
ncbi:MAG: hypothetical protein R2911_19015 [Caldilineaceae bacterium]